MRIIKHNLVKANSYMAIIPYGDYLNASVVDCDENDLFVTLDDNIVRIISKSFVPVNSDIADSMSIAIYGAPIKSVYKKMKKLWGRDINRVNVILIVMERLGWRDEFVEETIENKKEDGTEKEEGDDVLWEL